MINFKLLTNKNIKKLHMWLQLPHIRAFWDDGDRTIQEVINHYLQSDHVQRCIIFIDGQYMGYIQSYDIDGYHEYKKFTSQNTKIIGIDYFIGNTNFLGHGFAIPILKTFIKLHHPNKTILVDPLSKNHKAIHIYKKFGFIKTGECIIKNQSHEIMLYSISNLRD